MRRYIRGLMAAALLGSTTACLDLNVLNENLPDIERALGEPADVEQVIASSFYIWHSVLHGLADVSMVYPALADEGTMTATNRNVFWGQEPRQPLINDPLASQVWVPRRPWDNFAECAANANDGLRQIKQGMLIRTTAFDADTVVDNTDRAFAIAKFWQGVCIGYLALSMDRFATATEDTILPAGYDNLLEWEKVNIKPYQQGLEVALRSLSQAIARMETGENWSTDFNFVPGQIYTRDQWKQVAHTMAARIMIYSARSPEERAGLDWATILQHTEQGMDPDFEWGPMLQSGVLTDGSYLWRISQSSTSTNSSNFRADPYLMGPADQSGNFKKWLGLGLEARDTFLIRTPDRRITGTNPNSNGAYFRYRPNNSGVSNTALGTQHFSSYQWFRRINYQGLATSNHHQNGHQVLASGDENRLFRAEALMRLNRAAEAVPLINATRTRPVKVGTNTNVANLPPVTVTGAPLVNDACVPRKVLRWVDRTPANADVCGDLWDALMWERQIELYGQNPMRAWQDFRGFGQLQPGTLLHMPVPARYLTSLGIPFYTFGGIGQEGSAPGNL
jgi:hypothetical protein